MSSIYCYVDVAGEPTDVEDSDVPGVYEVEVQLPRPIDLAALTPVIETAIAKAVLDEFHENFGISCLDDFDIKVRLADGTPISEADLGDDLEAALSGLQVKATYHGQVGPVELPFDLAGHADRPRESGV